MFACLQLYNLERAVRIISMYLTDSYDVCSCITWKELYYNWPGKGGGGGHRGACASL